MAISKVTLNGVTQMDVTGNTSDTDNMLYGIVGTRSNGTSATGTVVTVPVDSTLDITSTNAIQNSAVATALNNKMTKGYDYVTAGQLSGSTLGSHATAEGNATVSSATASHAEGSGTNATNSGAHAEGSSTTASGISSHAEGTATTASAQAAHAEGYGSSASTQAAHAEGTSTAASGEASHAEGSGSSALGFAAHAEGTFTSAIYRSQHTFGEYNILDPYEGLSTARGTYVEIVGNGTASNAKSNARTLDWNGNEILAGKLTVGTAPTNNMDVATKQYVDTGLDTKQNTLSSSNILPVSSGGTGQASFNNTNAILVSSSSSTTGAIGWLRSTAGALYTTGTDVKPQYGSLPLQYGGTGYTDAEKPGFFVAGYTNLITNGDFMSIHDWDSSTNVPTGWTRNSNLVITDQIISNKRIYLTNNTYGSGYAQMQWVTNQLMSNNANKNITFSVKYGSTAIKTMTAQVNSAGTAITNNNVEFDNMHLYITPNNDGYIVFTIRLESTMQNLYVYAAKGEFAARQSFQDLYGNLMGSPIPISSGGTGVNSLPFGDILGTDETGRIVTSRSTVLDLDNPPYSGLFNVSSGAATTGTKPISTAHTGVCLVLKYAGSNWTELYFVTRTGSTTSGSPATRIFQRTYYYNGTTGTTTAWVEYTHS